MLGERYGASHCYFWGSRGLKVWSSRDLRLGESTAFTSSGGLICAGIHGNFPAAVGELFPDGEVASGGNDGLAILVFRAAFVVSPGESHVVGWAHLGALGGPGELVDLGVPVGVGYDGTVAEDGGEAGAEGH